MADIGATFRRSGPAGVTWGASEGPTSEQLGPGRSSIKVTCDENSVVILRFREPSGDKKRQDLSDIHGRIPLTDLEEHEWTLRLARYGWRPAIAATTHLLSFSRATGSASTGLARSARPVR